MTKTPNKSEAYRTLLNMFRQTYGNAALLCLASVETGEYILTILGTDEKLTLKALPLADIAVGDLVYVNASGDWVRLPGNSIAIKKFLTQTGTGTASAVPAWGVVLQADVSGLTTTDSPTFVTTKLSSLTDGKIPYHVDDSTGLADGPTKTDVDSAISLKHTQGTDQGLDTGGANATTAAEVKGAVTNSHVAVTVSAPISLSGQALSLVNDAAGTITEIDTGALANSDTVIPTSKAVTTAIAGAGGGGVDLVDNLKLVVNAAVNKLDVFTKSGGSAPDASNKITVSVPDGSGYTARERAGTVASGTGQIVFADATDYWSKGSKYISLGTSTTQFDITNPAGTTARYTFDGTGVDPGITTTWPRIGEVVVFNAQNFNAANNGAFVITGVGANYIEVTNASVVAETDKTIGTGSVRILRPSVFYLYAIWSAADSGIVWGARGFAGFTKVSTTTTATDDDFILLEESSTYTRVATDFCVVAAKMYKTYYVMDTPDHRIMAVYELAPQVMWNPKSDYSGTATLATTFTQASDIADDTSRVNKAIKQSGTYFVSAQSHVLGSGTGNNLQMYIKAGNSAYASAAMYGRALILTNEAAQNKTLVCFTTLALNEGDYIHLGFYIGSASGNRIIYGDDDVPGETAFTFMRTD